MQTAEKLTAFEAEKATLAEILIERGDIEAELDRLAVELSRPYPTDRQSLIAEAALAELEGRPAPQMVTDKSPLILRRDELRKRREVVAEKIRLQQMQVDRAQNAASAAVGQERRTEYAQIIKSIAAAVITLGQAAEAEQKFRTEFADAGLSFSAGITAGELPFDDFKLSNEYSKPAIYLRQSIAAGYVTADEIEALHKSAKGKA